MTRRATRRAGTTDGRRVAALLAGAVVAAVAGAVLAGCTPGAEPSPTTSGPTEQAEPTEPTAEAELGPLDALLATVLQDSAESPEARLARLERSEEVTAACMAEQGFEYEAFDWRAREEALAEPRGYGDDVPDDPIAFAAEYGYGVFTSDALSAQLQAPGAANEDPNAERVAAMSTAEERAWYLALWGPGDESTADEPYDWTKYGCAGRAAHETGIDEAAVFDDSAWMDLRDQISALSDTVLAHPDMADVQAAWTACMDDAGHPGYATINDPMAELMRRSEAIWTEAGQGVQLDLSTDDYLTDPAYLAQQAEIAERSAEMVEVETALAVADYTCRAETGYEERMAQVWLTIQEEFYEAHRADLDAWLAAYEEFAAAAG